MADASGARVGLELAVARFPCAAGELRRLAASDGDFREVCEEYRLARESLALFEARPDAAERPEVSEYRALIVEIEAEISGYATGGCRRR